MLLDLLSLCETAIDDDIKITNLDLIIATRTINRKLQTSISNINEEVIGSLPKLLEVDLATKGIVDLIGKKINVKMDYANNQWGLVCADFLANLTYNKRHKEQIPFFEALEQKHKYFSFDSFGEYEVRRASIAERDKDYVLALYRWLVILLKEKKNRNNAEKSIEQLLNKIFTRKDSSNGSNTIESVIEKLWRNFNSPKLYKDLSVMLDFFHRKLENLIKKNNFNILFRLRNFNLIIENHIGNTDKSKKIITKQNKIIPIIATNPEFFNLILDFKSLEIEYFINILDFEKAFLLSKNYKETITNYKEVWKLLIENEYLEDFDKSRSFIKSEMSLLRCKILLKPIIDADISNRIDFIASLLSDKGDISRLNNYRIMFLLKEKKPKKAFILAYNIFNNQIEKRMNFFDFFWFLRTINDTILNNEDIRTYKYQKIIESQENFLNPNDKGHPIDLIWRELALYELLENKNKNLALKKIKKSYSSYDLGNSPISNWIYQVIKIHEDFIKNRNNIELNEYLKEFESIPILESLKNRKDRSTLIQEIRYVTPY